MDMNFALGVLLDDGLGYDQIIIQHAGGFDLLDGLLGGVLPVEGEGQDVVYC